MADHAASAENSQAGSQQAFQEAVTRALIAHDRELGEVKQATQIDLLVCDPKLKQEAFDAWHTAGLTDKRVEVLKVLAQRCVQDGIPGGTRLLAETNLNLSNSLLRFKPRFPDSLKEGSPWKICVTFSLGASSTFRGAFSDMIAHGGNERLKIRRPLILPGRSVQELAQTVLGKDLKGKGKGKSGKAGKGKNKGGKNKDKGKAGRGKDKAAATVAPRSVSPPPVAASSGANPTATPIPEMTPPLSAPPGKAEAEAGSYAAAAASDESAQLLAEGSAKRAGEDDCDKDAPGLKKSNSPAAERAAATSRVC